MAESQGDVTISEEAVLKVVASLKDGKLPGISRVGYPLQFTSVHNEINFIIVMAMLGFGAAYEPLLQKKVQNSVEDAVKFGVIGAHLSGATFDAGYLRCVTAGDVAGGFNIPALEPAPSDIPGLTIEQPGELGELVKKYAQVMNGVGQRLEELQCESLAHFVINAAGEEHSGALLVKSLVATFKEAFDDVEDVEADTEGEERKLPFYKNAQAVVSELHHRMGKKVPALRVDDIDALTAMTDAPTITGLLHSGVVVPRNKDVLKPEKTPLLRAAAIQACQVMSAHVPSSPLEIGRYFAFMTKKKDFKGNEHYVPHKSMYI
ncbi:unnamed protein product [Chrysoparadoxa australica]